MTYTRMSHFVVATRKLAILSFMDKPKLTLVPPPPSLPLDVPQSRTWSDGSGLIVTADAITLIEARPKYSVGPPSTNLSLVAQNGCVVKR